MKLPTTTLVFALFLVAGCAVTPEHPASTSTYLELRNRAVEVTTALARREVVTANPAARPAAAVAALRELAPRACPELLHPESPEEADPRQLLETVRAGLPLQPTPRAPGSAPRRDRQAWETAQLALGGAHAALRGILDPPREGPSIRPLDEPLPPFDLWVRELLGDTGTR